MQEAARARQDFIAVAGAERVVASPKGIEVVEARIIEAAETEPPPPQVRSLHCTQCPTCISHSSSKACNHIT